MRVNLPVVAQEYAFPPGETLVSTTDLKGCILYCNPMFIEVSGYQKEELLGQPHNIVRHPDMPQEAYRDMWDTVGRGIPWSAVVKNRRKDGTFYWVLANVTPLMHGDQPTGYMSVRTEASRAQIQAAETLYAQMQVEKKAGAQVLGLHRGQVVHHNVWGRISARLSLSVGAKIGLSLLLPVLVGMVAAVVGGQQWSVGSVLVWLFAVLLAMGLAKYLHATTVAPITQMLHWANRMAAGDLTQKIVATRDNTLGHLQKALAQLNVNLLSIVRDARMESENMQLSTREIAQGNQDLSMRTEQQAANLQQTAGSMEEITGTVKQTVASAQQATVLAGQATQVAERSSQAVQSVVTTMNQIQNASGRISDITQIIDSIAFQTNILALNAAVEAARAGEQGRGFAVVASEVRSLSHRTQSAAKEIRHLITESVKTVQEGQDKTLAAQKAMDESLTLVRNVSTLMGEIHSASNEQLSGISLVNDAVAQLDSITQQNAALVEENAASAVQLAGQAQTVTETVQVFRIDGKSAPKGSDAVGLRRAQKAALAATAPTLVSA